MAPSFVEWEVARQASVGSKVFLSIGFALLAIAFLWVAYKVWARRRVENGNERKDRSE